MMTVETGHGILTDSNNIMIYRSLQIMPVETGHGILTDSNNIMIYRSRPNYAG